MATTIQPAVTITVEQTIANTGTLAITMPGGAGKFRLLSLIAFGSDGTVTLAVDDGTNTFLSATAPTATGKTFLSEDPTAAVGATLTLTGGGASGTITYVAINLVAASGYPLATA